jgi:two-component system sensor histidine kinase VanS
MKLRINTKVFLGVVGLIVFQILMTWLVNSLFFTDFYLSYKKGDIAKTFWEIEEMSEQESDESIDNLLDFIVQISRMKGYHTMVFDRDMNVILEMNERQRGMGRRGQVFFHQFIEEWHKEREGENFEYSTRIQKDPSMGGNVIFLHGKINEDLSLVIKAPLVPIVESINYSNRFNLFVAFLAFLVGSLIAYLFSVKLTARVLELSRITKDMANLNFSQKFIGEEVDEIGELGNNINKMSIELESNIKRLELANENLKAENERKKKIDEMRKNFISNVSHELKTPLALIMGYAEGLKENVATDEESRKYYSEVIIDEIKKMNGMVLELLDLSKLNSEHEALSQESIDLVPMIQKIVKRQEIILKSKSLHIEENYHESRRVYADRAKLEQVLVNLVTNALSYSENGTTIRIETKKNNDKLRFSIWNQAEPIPEEELENIWIQFYKIDKARIRNKGGTGIGLAIVKRIVELHHNECGVENVAGGVQFWIEIDLES